MDRVASAKLEQPWNRDLFLRTLLRELAGSLEDVVGLTDAEGFISLVGQQIGETLDQEYRAALRQDRLTPKEVGEVLVDLKRRIQGDFFVIEESDEKIVLGNRRCPFGELVRGRRSMCMMTSNVFGTIAAENLGYAKVALDETIAEGHAGCRVTLYLSDGPEAEASDGREYYRVNHSDAAE